GTPRGGRRTVPMRTPSSGARSDPRRTMRTLTCGRPPIARRSPLRDVLVVPEHVLRVPLLLHFEQASPVVSIGGLGALSLLFFGEEVDVGAAGAERAHVLPRGSSPLDVHGVVLGLLPGTGEVQNPLRVTVADRGLRGGNAVERATEREEDHRAVRTQRAPVLDRLREDGGIQLRQVLGLPVVAPALGLRRVE